MKKNNKKITNKKELPIMVNLLLIMLFSGTFIAFGVGIGLLINSFINPLDNNILINILLVLLVGIVYIILLLILLRNSDREKEKTTKWYINSILLSFTLTLIVTAVTVFVSGNDNSITNYLIGTFMFPLIGIITTPNIVKHVKNDTQKWKQIFYGKGNLHTVNSEEHYRVKTPVSFEKKNVLVVIAFMVFIIGISINYMVKEHRYADDIIGHYMSYRAERSFGLFFFLMLLFLAFGIPIIAYYISHALKKIRVVKNHEYITIYYKNKYYSYNYCTCVGIKEKNVKFTPATLIFVPDDVLIFPDNDEYKVDKIKKKRF